MPGINIPIRPLLKNAAAPAKYPKNKIDLRAEIVKSTKHKTLTVIHEASSRSWLIYSLLPKKQ